MKFFSFCFLFILGFSLTNSIYAQIAAPYKGATHSQSTLVSGSYSSSAVDYQFDDNNAEIERKILGLGIQHKLSPKMRLIGQLGLIIDSETNPGAVKDGSGFILGMGVQGDIWQKNNLGAQWYGLFSHLNENLETPNSAEFDVSTNEIHLGGIFYIAIEKNFFPYVGLELIPYSDGTIKSKEGSGEGDIERDDFLNMRLGFIAQVDNIELGLDICTGGEQAFMLFAGAGI